MGSKLVHPRIYAAQRPGGVASAQASPTATRAPNASPNNFSRTPSAKLTGPGVSSAAKKPVGTAPSAPQPIPASGTSSAAASANGSATTPPRTTVAKAQFDYRAVRARFEQMEASAAASSGRGPVPPRQVSSGIVTSNAAAPPRPAGQQSSPALYGRPAPSTAPKPQVSKPTTFAASGSHYAPKPAPATPPRPPMKVAGAASPAPSPGGMAPKSTPKTAPKAPPKSPTKPAVAPQTPPRPATAKIRPFPAQQPPNPGGNKVPAVQRATSTPLQGLALSPRDVNSGPSSNTPASIDALTLSPRAQQEPERPPTQVQTPVEPSKEPARPASPSPPRPASPVTSVPQLSMTTTTPVATATEAAGPVSPRDDPVSPRSGMIRVRRAPVTGRAPPPPLNSDAASTSPATVSAAVEPSAPAPTANTPPAAGRKRSTAVRGGGNNRIVIASPTLTRPASQSNVTPSAARKYIVNEIVNTEETFVEDVKKTIAYFLSPLRSMPKLISAVEVGKLFANIEMIQIISTETATELRQAVTSAAAPEDALIGGVFSKNSSNLESAFAQYCRANSEALQLLGRLQKKSAFASALQALENVEDVLPGGPLLSYLVRLLSRFFFFFFFFRSVDLVSCWLALEVFVGWLHRQKLV